MQAKPNNSTFQVGLFECPACHTDVYGTASVELTLQEVIVPGSDEIQAAGKLSGVRVAHDCIPKVTR